MIGTETFLIPLISLISRTMRSRQGNAKTVQRKTKSIKVVYKVLSVNPKVVCNPHVEPVVLWDFMCFIVRFKGSQIM